MGKKSNIILMDLKSKVLKGLEILDENDRDIRTLMIWINPNHKYGADQDIQPKMLEILRDLEKRGIISKKEKKLNVYSTGQRSKEFKLWSIKDV